MLAAEDVTMFVSKASLSRMRSPAIRFVVARARVPGIRRQWKVFM